MSLASAILARRIHLWQAQTGDVVRERDQPVAMDDGAILLADRWIARESRPRPAPTVLVRSPYGRGQFVGLVFGRLLAERGLQVVIQSVRGTFGSEGEFSPFEERADGLATLRWIREQPWHRGRIGMIGPSYMGLTQWALAAEAGDDLAALAIQASASQFHGQTYGAGSLSLESAASWLVLVTEQERLLAPLLILHALRRLRTLFSQLPVGELDIELTGAKVGWFREGLASPRRDDAYWVVRDFAAGVATVSARVQLIGGWYDIFLPWMLEDFVALQEAGRAPQLVIGPWTHSGPELMARGMREGLAWLRAGLLEDERMLRPASIRIRMTGEQVGDRWRELASWPPPGTGERRLWLAANGRLLETAPGDDPPGDGPPRAGPTDADPADADLADADQTRGDRYRYDPAAPTPSVGGPVLLERDPVRDNRELEARPDVLVYTTEPLSSPVEAIGPVRVELWARCSSPYFDIFARVCDVDRAGASWNVCDALKRVSPEHLQAADDGGWLVAFDLWPIGHRFAAGNRIRLQVSSGAHPRYARNPGTGEDLATASTLRAVEVEICRDRSHPSVLVLPRG